MTPAPQHSVLSHQAPQSADLPPQAQELLEQMHGIITPAPVSWWPPAVGWWIVAAALLAALLILMLTLRQRRRQEAYRRAALQRLELLHNCPEAQLPTEANRLLKRIALAAFPADQLTINQAFGTLWVDWLNAHCRQPVFSGAAATALAHGGYQPNVSCPRDELLASLQRWVREHHRASLNQRNPARA
jgi:hypothetical protein